MDTRLKNIDRLLTSYATGDFRKRARLSKRLDDTDAVFSALHMLAEELEVVMVSRDRYDAMFNALGDMMLVLTPQGRIEQVNNAVCDRLGFRKRDLLGHPVEVLTGKGPSLIRQLQRRRGPLGQSRIWDRSLVTAEGEAVPVEIDAKLIMRQDAGANRAYLLTVHETSLRREREYEALRYMTKGQEEERARVAKELHDGLQSQAMGMEFLLAAAMREDDQGRAMKLLHEVGEQLKGMQRALRDVCFELAPPDFAERGLIDLVEELSERVGMAGALRMEVEVMPGCPVALAEMPREMQMDVYRVIQEFLSNSLKHGEATYLLVRFGGKGRTLEVLMRENGKGFDPAGVLGRGMGIRNMHSRIRSHGGRFSLRSSRGKGTQGRICLTVDV